MEYDGKVVISTALDNSGIEKGVNSVAGSLGGLKTVLGKLSGLIAAAFSVTAVVQFGVESSKAAMQLSDALTGLQSIVDGQGRSFSKAQAFIEEYTKDGLIPATNAITAYKNLAMRGYDDSQIQQVMVALKDASAYGRQASYSMGEAVQSATEGLKNENSILVDNAGVTKNVAKMWEDYAKSIGTTANNLTKQQKIQAEVSGILDESKFQTGDAAKAAGTLSGQLQQLTFNFNNLKIAVGNIINPIAKSFLPIINAAITAVTRFANTLAAISSSLFGEASSGMNSYAASVDKAEEEQKKLEKQIGKTGKTAQKELAGFDEITKLADSSADGSTTVPDISSGITGIVDEAQVESNIAPAVQAIVDTINRLFEPLRSFDLTPAKESIEILSGAFMDFLGNVGTVLDWLWFNVLVPLGKWTIEEAAPKAVDALTAAFEGLNETITVLFDAVSSVWSDLEPIVSWIEDTGIQILEDLRSIGEDIAAIWQKNAPKIKKAFQNIGTVIQKVWAVIGPIITWIKDAISSFSSDVPGNELQYLIDRIFAISEILAGLVTFDFAQVFRGVGAAAEAEFTYAKDQTISIGKALSYVFNGIVGVAKNVWSKIAGFFEDAWSSVKETWKKAGKWFDDKVITPIKDFFAPISQWFSEKFGSIFQSVADVFYNIGVVAQGCWTIIKEAWDVAYSWFDETIIQPVSELFSSTWESISTWAADAWADITEVYNSVASWFDENLIQPVKEFFSDLWESFAEKAQEAWENVKETFRGIGEWFKEILNEAIGAINSALTGIFDGINKTIKKLKDFKIGESQPFADMRTITVPQIPYLARGAVLPANKPFMAVLGDQRHGTNIEAPLSTIQEALGVVMQDYIASNMAGHEATVGVLREILQAVLGIEIGDATIAEAVARYNRKLSVARGG